MSAMLRTARTPIRVFVSFCILASSPIVSSSQDFFPAQESHLQVISPFDAAVKDISASFRERAQLKLILRTVIRGYNNGLTPVSPVTLNGYLDAMSVSSGNLNTLRVLSTPVFTEKKIVLEIQRLQGDFEGEMLKVTVPVERIGGPVHSSPFFTVDRLPVYKNDIAGLTLYDTREIPLTISAGIHLHENTAYIGLVSAADDSFEPLYLELPLDGKNDRFLILSALSRIEQENNIRILNAGISGLDTAPARKLGAYLWLNGDHAWTRLASTGVNYKDIVLDNSRKASAFFMDKENFDVVYVGVDPDTREVQVADITDPLDHKNTVSETEWLIFEKLVNEVRGEGMKVVFFSSTPRGGGVALMRHALVSLLRSKGVDISWHVMSDDDPSIFEITKKKLHNVFQGVSDKPVSEQFLTQAEKISYRDWCRHNATHHFSEEIRAADVIVIDDYQPSGMIPLIKEMNPGVKIIYRSHIQLQSHLIDDPFTPQNHNWDFIWSNIKDDIDIFLSHPLEIFIPGNVDNGKVMLMPAATDPLDGLNKPLSVVDMSYYISLFNRYLENSGQTALDPFRPYIIQVARLDPSKGIPDVFEAYGKWREKLKGYGIPEEKMPQLVIAGHGAIDDPDGKPILDRTLAMKSSEKYAGIAHDIKVARLPDNDQVLNALLRGSFAALQLSHAEGWEVKVSEALDKGKPVISYNAGGIPLQIIDGVNGFVVPDLGNTEKVADCLTELFMNRDRYEWMSVNARELRRKDVWTVPNAINWLHVANQLHKGNPLEGDREWVRSSAYKLYENTVTPDEPSRAYARMASNDRLGRFLSSRIKSLLDSFPREELDQRPIDISIDLSLIPAEQTLEEETLTDLALLIFSLRDFHNVRFIFEKTHPLLDGKDLPFSLQKESENAMTPQRALALISDRIRSMPVYEAEDMVITNTLITERLLAERPAIQAPETIEIPFLSKLSAEWMKVNGIVLSPRQFPVVLSGSSGESRDGWVFRNFQAAFITGIMKASLVIARDISEEEGDPSAYLSARARMVPRLNSIYSVSRDDIVFDETSLDYLIHRDPVQRLNRAIEAFLPPLTRMPVKQLQELHKALQLLLRSA